MAHATPGSQSFVSLAKSFKRFQVPDALAKQQSSTPRLARSYATHTKLPTASSTNQSAAGRQNVPSNTSKAAPPSADKFHPPVLTTLYSWPSMEPTSYTSYKYHYLNLPLRKDILHRAVVFEGNATRQGTASTKHRTQVHGSSRKLRPQKGTGRARLSDKKSPSIRGGGVAHGPHPRDFSTDLPSKVYDLAYRTALSYRYKKGELIVLNNEVELNSDQGPRWLHNFFETNAWGKGNGRTLVVARAPVAEFTETGAELLGPKNHLVEAMDQVGEHGEAQYVQDVDVKDLLAFGRIIIEKKALDQILRERSKNMTV